MPAFIVARFIAVIVNAGFFMKSVLHFHAAIKLLKEIKDLILTLVLK